MSETKLYLGKNRILEYNIGEECVSYTLEDGRSDTATEAQFHAMAKSEPYDDKMTQVYKWNGAVADIMGILLENRMMLIEKDFVLGRVDETVRQNYATAAARLFGAPHEEFINLKHIDNVLKEQKMEDEQVVVEPTVEEVAVEETPAAEEEVAA